MLSKNPLKVTSSDALLIFGKNGKCKLTKKSGPFYLLIDPFYGSILIFGAEIAYKIINCGSLKVNCDLGKFGNCLFFLRMENKRKKWNFKS